jgi:hypothetical protein
MRKTRPFTAQALALLVLLLSVGACDLFVPTTTHPTPTPEFMGYRNEEYGFSFSLPESWNGYSIRISEWEARDTDQGDEVVDHGPMIWIVHPTSTPEQPRQDIPIMVFTIQQRDNILYGTWHIGAAPIPPSELGRNSQYAFALPARYNYAYAEGWEEVEQILAGDPLETFEP